MPSYRSQKKMEQTAQQDLDKRVEQYISLRDALRTFDERKAAERKNITDCMAVLEGKMEAAMKALNVEALKTKHGTCYKSVRYTATLADPGAFMDYVITNSKWELLDRRANSTAVKGFVEKNNALPPGCNLNALESVGVRRNDAK